MIKLGAICLAIGISIGFGSGFYVSNMAHKVTKANLGTCKQDIELLRRATDAQNAAIKNQEAISHELRIAKKQALIGAESRIKELEADVVRIAETQGETCQDGISLINQELGL